MQSLSEIWPGNPNHTSFSRKILSPRMMDRTLLAICLGILRRELLVECVGLRATIIYHFRRFLKTKTLTMAENQ